MAAKDEDTAHILVARSLADDDDLEVTPGDSDRGIWNGEYLYSIRGVTLMGTTTENCNEGEVEESTGLKLINFQPKTLKEFFDMYPEKLYESVTEDMKCLLLGEETKKELTVDTPAGQLVAEVAVDFNHPGIQISLKEGDVKHFISLVDSDQGLIYARVWKKDCENDPDYSAAFEPCECCHDLE